MILSFCMSISLNNNNNKIDKIICILFYQNIFADFKVINLI